MSEMYSPLCKAFADKIQFCPFVIITSPGNNNYSCTELASIWAPVNVIRFYLRNFYAPLTMPRASYSCHWCHHAHLLWRSLFLPLVPSCDTSCDVHCIFAVSVSLRDTTVWFVGISSTSTSTSPVGLLLPIAFRLFLLLGLYWDPSGLGLHSSHRIVGSTSFTFSQRSTHCLPVCYCLANNRSPYSVDLSMRIPSWR